LKRWDILLIIVLIAAAALIWLSFSTQKNIEKGVAVIRINGEETQTLDLSFDDTYTIKGQNFSCEVTVKNGSVGITKSPCPDQTCIHMGFINQPNRTIVCLPNLLSISIRETSAKDQHKDQHDVDTITF
jgi:hypothetical protein